MLQTVWQIQIVSVSFHYISSNTSSTRAVKSSHQSPPEFSPERDMVLWGGCVSLWRKYASSSSSSCSLCFSHLPLASPTCMSSRAGLSNSTPAMAKVRPNWVKLISSSSSYKNNNNNVTLRPILFPDFILELFIKAIAKPSFMISCLWETVSPTNVTFLASLVLIWRAG